MQIAANAGGENMENAPPRRHSVKMSPRNDGARGARGDLQGAGRTARGALAGRGAHEQRGGA